MCTGLPTCPLIVTNNVFRHSVIMYVQCVISQCVIIINTLNAQAVRLEITEITNRHQKTHGTLPDGQLQSHEENAG